jgi:alpha-beta hydrolase superfamily lysophospholipase
MRETSLKVHDSQVETIRVHGDHHTRLRREVVELTGDTPLYAVRTQLPDGAQHGPPVVLIHGFAQNRYSWHTSTRSMTAWLAQRGWDVWNLELRGHGRSREGGHTEQFSDYVEDILRFQSNLAEPGFWVGHSLGGCVAYAGAAAASGSGAPRGVVGIGAVYRFGRSGPLLPALCRLTHRVPKAKALGRIQIHTGLTGRFLSRVFPLMDSAAYWAPMSGWWPGSIERELAAERMSHGFDWIPVKIWEEMSDWASTDSVPWDAAWRATDVPVYVVLGDKDSMQYPDDGRAAYDRSGSQDRTLKVFNDWDDGHHFGHLDLVLGCHAPDHVWPAVESWMAARV